MCYSPMTSLILDTGPLKVAYPGTMYEAELEIQKVSRVPGV